MPERPSPEDQHGDAADAEWFRVRYGQEGPAGYEPDAAAAGDDPHGYAVPAVDAEEYAVPGGAERYGDETQGYAVPETFEAWASAGADDVLPPRREERGRRRGRTGWLVGGVVAALVLAGGGAWLGLRGGGAGTANAPAATPRPTPPGPETIGRQYLEAWAAGQYGFMDTLVLEESDDVLGVYTRMADRLKVQRTVVTPGTFDPATATLPYSVVMTLEGGGEFAYDGALQLVNVTTAGSQTPTPSPTPSEPSGLLREGWRVKFTAQTVHPLLQNGQRLALASADADGSPARAAVLDRKGRPIAADDDLAANVLGTAPSGGAQGSGLLRAFADRLGGSAGRQVVIADVTTGKTVEVLKELPGTPATKVTTTLDLDYQKAARKALAKARPGPRAAIVAIDTRTGAVLAMANKQISGVPTAQNGVYPPGSTFKVLTAIAGLEHGLTPSSKVPCPNEMSVVGKVFRNHEKSSRTSLTLTQAFAASCNTAFIAVARGLPDGALQETASRFGFAAGPGGESLLPISAARGDIPATPQQVDLAASAIGQGKVQATPLHMASVAAGIASGTWRQPRLTPDCADCASNPVPAASAMRTLMRAVVTSGTASAMRGIKGGPVYAKTGTPEWGSDDPPATHGWLIGWQGHTAFAVFVENGASGAEAAVPVASAFLKALPAGH